jgi:hypothetical protein
MRRVRDCVGLIVGGPTAEAGVGKVLSSGSLSISSPMLGDTSGGDSSGWDQLDLLQSLGLLKSVAISNLSIRRSMYTVSISDNYAGEQWKAIPAISCTS